MEKKFNDSSSALSRFARDKRVRTVTAAPERVERRPRTEKAQDGYRRDDKAARPAKRASYNPHFSEDNRPLFEQKEERRNSKFSAAGRGRTNKDERRTFGDKKQGTEKPFEKKFDKKFSDKKAFGDKKRSFKRDDERPRNYPKFNPERQTGDIRLNRFLAQSGICSRREADDYITSGAVTVNDVVVTELGSKVSQNDVVKLDGKVLKSEKMVYIVMNKPKGYVTTASDPHADKTVMDLLKGCPSRVFPVGRLDKNTTGVLMFTNDGEIAEKLTHPSYDKKKIYQVSLDGKLKKEDYDKILSGIELNDGLIAADELEYIEEDDHRKLGIEIHSGKNRIVRRIFESLGYEVKALDRVYFAGLTKRGLKRGEWRYLTEGEINLLRMGAYL